MFSKVLGVLAFSTAAVWAQAPTVEINDAGGFARITRPYRSPQVPPVSFQDSNRIENLLRLSGGPWASTHYSTKPDKHGAGLLMVCGHHRILVPANQGRTQTR